MSWRDEIDNKIKQEEAENTTITQEQLSSLINDLKNTFKSTNERIDNFNNVAQELQLSNASLIQSFFEEDGTIKDLSDRNGRTVLTSLINKEQNNREYFIEKIKRSIPESIPYNIDKNDKEFLIHLKSDIIENIETLKQKKRCFNISRIVYSIIFILSLIMFLYSSSDMKSQFYINKIENENKSLHNELKTLRISNEENANFVRFGLNFYSKKKELHKEYNKWLINKNTYHEKH